MSGPGGFEGTIVAAPDLPDILPPVPVRKGVRGFVARHPAIAFGGGLLLAMLLVAVLAPFIKTVDPNAINPTRRLLAPGAGFWFGTDMLGRDIYSRVVYGARISLLVGLSVAVLAALAGTAVGMVSAMVRALDGFIMRVMDSMMSIPPILLAIALMALTGASIGNVILAIVLVEIPRVARVVRSTVLSLREQPFIDGAVVAGTRLPTIMVRHVLPNILAPLMVQTTYIAASAMIIESILSFLGVGLPASTPSWGNIMAEGRALWQVKFYIVLYPAIFLSLTVLAINLLGDGLRDALDPRAGQRG